MRTTDVGTQRLKSWPPGDAGMARRIRAYNWAATPCGAIDTWPASQRALVDAVLISQFPVLLLWGSDLVQIYNDAFAPLCPHDVLGRGCHDTTGNPAWGLPNSLTENTLAHLRQGETQTIKLSRHSDGFPADQGSMYLHVGPLPGEAGELLGLWVTSTDQPTVIRDPQPASKDQNLRLAELQHRVRNTMAVVRSLVRRTADTSVDVETFAMHLDGRINAYARVQAVAIRDPFAGFDLAQMIAEELLACAAHEGEQFSMTGDAVRLNAKTAERIGLAFHELATNALKHGALSTPKGRIHVEWHTVASPPKPPQLVLRWTESGMRGYDRAPVHRGFGTDLFEHTLGYDLDAEVQRSFEADGLVCVIAFPLLPLWDRRRG